MKRILNFHPPSYESRCEGYLDNLEIMKEYVGHVLVHLGETALLLARKNKDKYYVILSCFDSFHMFDFIPYLVLYMAV